MKPDTKHWQPGDVVSTASGIVGTVRRFGSVVKVQHGTPRRWDWPDGWVLGVGPREHRCLDCGHRYRTDDVTPDMCPACLREFDAAHAGHGRGIQKINGYLHGARTEHKPAPVDEATKARQADHAKDISDWDPFS